MNNEVNWQEVFNGPLRPFTLVEKMAVGWDLWPCSVYHPQLAEKLATEDTEGRESDLYERSVAFCGNVLGDNFEAAKEDHDFIKDWRPQWNT